MTKAQKCMDELLCTINPLSEREPIGHIRIRLIAEGLLAVAYYEDLKGASAEKRQIVNGVKNTALTLRQELRNLKETDTLMSSDLRSLFRTIREQGHSLCALILPGRVNRYELILGK